MKRVEPYFKAISTEEKRELLEVFNNSRVDFRGRKKSIMEYFLDWVKKTPENLALITEDTELTYRDLETKAQRLACLLQKKGVCPQTIVAIMVERSVEMIIGLFAILKAGGAYLPLDPDSPEKRLTYILNDSKTTILLTPKKITKKINFQGEIIFIDDAELLLDDQMLSQTDHSARDLAYVIYTSGSTGQPKGVLIEHQSMVNALLSHHYHYSPKGKWVNIFFASYTFDASILEIFAWIISGGQLVLLEPGVERDLRKILRSIFKFKATHVSFPPSLLNLMLTELPIDELQLLNRVAYIFVGGESSSLKMIKRFFNIIDHVELINYYGPTETTIIATQFPLRKADDYSAVLIGQPIANTQIYILDENLELVPQGEIGEICIGGLGLGRGYLGQPQLTREKFVPNPYYPERLMYRSGDLGKWLIDGNLAFCGRKDHQVQLRGFRVELEEVEKILITHPKIEEAISLVESDASGQQYLSAYINTNQELTGEKVRGFLTQHLPAYMVPTRYYFLDRFPKQLSGKIDRSALSNGEFDVISSRDYMPPKTDLQVRLAEIWRQILGVSRVGLNDSFFQLGGTSLSIVKLYERVQELLSTEIAVADLFSYHTIEMLTDYLAQKELKDDQYDDLLSKISHAELTPEEATKLFLEDQNV